MRRISILFVIALVGQALVVGTASAGKPSLSVKDAFRDEPLYSGTYAFVVRLSAPSSRRVRVDWETTGGTATPGADYVGASGTLAFKPGVTRRKILIQTLGDGIDEDDETFGIALSNPRRATIADGDATGTIYDVDPPPTVSIGNVSTLEGNSGSKIVTMTMSLSAESTKEIQVSLDAAGIDATEGQDWAPAGAEGLWVFAPGETHKFPEFTIYGDTDPESDEEFQATLSGPSNATLGKAVGVGLIIDDD